MIHSLIFGGAAFLAVVITAVIFAPSIGIGGAVCELQRQLLHSSHLDLLALMAEELKFLT